MRHVSFRVAGTVILVWGILWSATPGTHAAESVRGTVFDDRDGDGLRDDGEPGVGGVLVSNGLDVVATDADGSYRLDLEERSIVFVTKPAGWAVPVTEDNLPRFFYLHYPHGTPSELGLRYPGPEPSGALAGPIDFPLRKVEERDRFEAIWFSDPQPKTSVEIDYVRDDVVAELLGTNAAFGITVGDIMYDQLALFPRYSGVVGQVGIPWYSVPGNHDMNYRAETDRDSLESFKRHFGPPYYSFDYGRVHFVVLDTVRYLGRSLRHPRRAGAYEGRIDDRQLRWLENDLAHVPRDRPVVLAMHIPLRSFSEEEPAKVSVTNRPELFEALEGREQVLAVAGHMHNNEHHYFSAADGLDSPDPLHLHTLAAVCGNWWGGALDERGIPSAVQSDGTPNGYHVMSVDGTRVSMRYKSAGKPADYQMRVSFDTAGGRKKPGRRREGPGAALSGGRITVDQVAATEILVNLFDGGPNSRVEYRIGSRAPVVMRAVRRPDPFVEALYRRDKGKMKSFVSTAPCSHLWVAGLPGDLGPGVYTVHVAAMDEYGQRHEAKRILEITSR